MGCSPPPVGLASSGLLTVPFSSVTSKWPTLAPYTYLFLYPLQRETPSLEIDSFFTPYHPRLTSRFESGPGDTPPPESPVSSKRFWKFASIPSFLRFGTQKVPSKSKVWSPFCFPFMYSNQWFTNLDIVRSVLSRGLPIPFPKVYPFILLKKNR